MKSFALVRFALLFVATTFAMPAQAGICARFEQPLTQTVASELAINVRTMFAKKYQPLLENVKISVVDDEVDLLALSQTKSGSELVISATYLGTSCTLAVSSIFFNSNTALRRSTLSIQYRQLCGNLQLSERKACLFGLIDRAITGLENTPGSAEKLEDMTPLIEQMVISSLLFGLAHEYSHHLLDRGKTPFAQLAKRDSETAADLQALSIFASGRAWPVADTLLFAGRRELDALTAGAENGPSAHDTSYCRAARSAAIREKIVPSITAINSWRSGQDPSFALEVLSVAANNFTIGSNVGLVQCDLDLPSEITMIVQDLSKLTQWAQSWPKDEASQPRAIQALADLRTSTEFGGMARAGIAASYVNGPGLDAANHILNGSMTPEIAKNWENRFRRTRGILGNHDELALRDERKFRLTKAFSEFLSAPKGSSIERLFQKSLGLIDGLLADPNARPDAVDFWMVASLQLVGGHCQPALENAVSGMQALRNPLRQFFSAAMISNPEDRKSIRRTTDEFSDLADKSSGELITPKALESCKTNSVGLRKTLAGQMGWTISL